MRPCHRMMFLPNPEPEPPAEDRSEMQKAGNMMKKLFGQ